MQRRDKGTQTSTQSTQTSYGGNQVSNTYVEHMDMELLVAAAIKKILETKKPTKEEKTSE